MEHPQAINARSKVEMTAWATVLRWLQKLRSQHSPRRLRVAESLAIGEKRQLLIVECGTRQLLIGAAGNSLTTLAELDATEGKKTTCA